MAKRTVQAVDGDQLLSSGTSGISSRLCPLFLRQMALLGPGRGLFTEPVTSFTLGEEPESAGTVFSADHGELTACVMSKAAAGEEFPLLLCSRFSAAAACGGACDFLEEAIIWHLFPTPLPQRHLFSAQPHQAEIWHLPAHPPAPRWYLDGLSQLRVSWSSLIFLWCRVRPLPPPNKSHPSKQSNNFCAKIKGATGMSLKAKISLTFSTVGYALELGCAWEVLTTNIRSCVPHAEARVSASLVPSQPS